MVELTDASTMKKVSQDANKIAYVEESGVLSTFGWNESTTIIRPDESTLAVNESKDQVDSLLKSCQTQFPIKVGKLDIKTQVKENWLKRIDSVRLWS